MVVCVVCAGFSSLAKLILTNKNNIRFVLNEKMRNRAGMLFIAIQCGKIGGSATGIEYDHTNRLLAKYHTTMQD